jgi:hypothetical protein
MGVQNKEWFKEFVRKNGNENIGWRHDRMKIPCHSTDREKAFSNAWIKENKNRKGINYGFGILQDNFCDRENLTTNILHKINKRERVIVATVIQWLGTNVGWCWLNKTVNNAGYRIIKIKDEKENTLE